MKIGTGSVVNETDRVITVRFDGKDAYPIQPGLNRDIPVTFADLAKAQNPQTVRKATRDELDADAELTHGPTFEEYIAAGYPADKYPPQGYAERDSEGLRAYRAAVATRAESADSGDAADPLLPPTTDDAPLAEGEIDPTIGAVADAAPPVDPPPAKPPAAAAPPPAEPARSKKTGKHK